MGSWGGQCITYRAFHWKSPLQTPVHQISFLAPAIGCFLTAMGQVPRTSSGDGDLPAGRLLRHAWGGQHCHLQGRPVTGVEDLAARGPARRWAGDSNQMEGCGPMMLVGGQ